MELFIWVPKKLLKGARETMALPKSSVSDHSHGIRRKGFGIR